MREALAGTNHDYLLRDDDERSNVRRGRGKAKKSALTRLFGGRRRGVFFLSLVALAAIGIPLNALYLQDGRHPAPLFRLDAPEASVAPRVRQAEQPAPLPPARPAAAAPAPVAKPVAVKSEQSADLVDGGAPKAAAKSEEADKTVLAAQRALVKLGYVLRADGVFGGATRQALEKFERDSGLPVKGELTPKILRQLHARSGTPVE